MGLAMDVGDGTLFGQHALAYALLAYAAEYFRRRVLRFPLWQQAVAGGAAARSSAPALVLLVRVVRRGAAAAAGRTSCRRWSARSLWPLLSVLLQLPQRPVRSSSTL